MCRFQIPDQVVIAQWLAWRHASGEVPGSISGMSNFFSFFNTHLSYSLHFTVVCLCHITGGIPPPSGALFASLLSLSIYIDHRRWSEKMSPHQRGANKKNRFQILVWLMISLEQNISLNQWKCLNHNYLRDLFFHISFT